MVNVLKSKWLDLLISCGFFGLAILSPHIDLSSYGQHLGGVAIGFGAGWLIHSLKDLKQKGEGNHAEN